MHRAARATIRQAASPDRRADRVAWLRPTVYVTIAVTGLLIIAWGFDAAVRSYHDGVALAGKSLDPTPVVFSVGGETLSVPGNMLRFASARSGGAAEAVDLVLSWPALEGFTEGNADAFRDGSALAPLIHATIEPRDNPLDSDGRLSSVYAPFFVGDAVDGPSGLIGHRMSDESGYRSEIVFYAPRGQPRFAARCVLEATPEVPATCMRDVNIGAGLTMLYRFNRFFLGDWAELDRRLKALALGLLAAP